MRVTLLHIIKIIIAVTVKIMLQKQLKKKNANVRSPNEIMRDQLWMKTLLAKSYYCYQRRLFAKTLCSCFTPSFMLYL